MVLGSYQTVTNFASSPVLFRWSLHLSYLFSPDLSQRTGTNLQTSLSFMTQPAITLSSCLSSSMTLTGFLKHKNSCWPDPEASIGRECMNIQSYVCFEAKGPALDIFLKLAPQIQVLLDDHRDGCFMGCEEQPRTISYHIWMVGHQRPKAKPTLIISSKSKSQRLAAKDLIRDSGLLDQFPGVQLKTLDKRPAVLQADYVNSFMAVDRNDNTLYVIGTPTNPCGALLTLGSRRKATLGGVIIIGGQYYGMTALHRQHCEDQETESQDDDGKIIAFDDDSDLEQEEPIDVMSKGSISSGKDSVISSSSPPSSDTYESTCTITRFLSRESSLPESGSMTVEGSASYVHYQANEQSYHKIGTLSNDEIGDTDYEIFRIDDPYYHAPNILVVTDRDEFQKKPPSPYTNCS